MGEREIEASILIDAPPKRVWDLLTDFPRMPDWNPFIRSISGSPTPGSRLSVQIVPPGKRGMRFKPTVLVANPERELRWFGRFLMPGLVDGEHYFLLAAMPDGRTRFTQGEKFTGFLVTILSATVSAAEDGFKAMNASLKQRAEQETSRDARSDLD